MSATRKPSYSGGTCLDLPLYSEFICMSSATGQRLYPATYPRELKGVAGVQAQLQQQQAYCYLQKPSFASSAFNKVLPVWHIAYVLTANPKNNSEICSGCPWFGWSHWSQ